MMKEALQNLAAVITALAALVGAAAPIVLEVLRRRDRKRVKPSAAAEKAPLTKRERVVRKLAISSVGGIALTLSCVLVLILWLPKMFGTKSGRQEILADAFVALENKRWEDASKKASEVIEEFGGNAFLEQEKLERTTELMPPVGKVAQDLQAAIFARGVLNDVAAAYFIKGRALEHLGRTQEARKVYQEGARFTYARTWDPREGVFWSPAEAVLGRLRTLPP
jgi:hypothetical protein